MAVSLLTAFLTPFFIRHSHTIAVKLEDRLPAQNQEFPPALFPPGRNNARRTWAGGDRILSPAHAMVPQWSRRDRGFRRGLRSFAPLGRLYAGSEALQPESLVHRGVALIAVLMGNVHGLPRLRVHDEGNCPRKTKRARPLRRAARSSSAAWPGSSGSACSAWSFSRPSRPC